MRCAVRNYARGDAGKVSIPFGNVSRLAFAAILARKVKFETLPFRHSATCTVQISRRRRRGLFPSPPAPPASLASSSPFTCVLPSFTRALPTCTGNRCTL